MVFRRHAQCLDPLLWAHYRPQNLGEILCERTWRGFVLLVLDVVLGSKTTLVVRREIQYATEVAFYMVIIVFLGNV